MKSVVTVAPDPTYTANGRTGVVTKSIVAGPTRPNAYAPGVSQLFCFTCPAQDGALLCPLRKGNAVVASSGDMNTS